LRSARGQNKILSEKVKELSMKVKVLTVENQSLLAEVEMYRKEALSGFSKPGQALPEHVDSQEGGAEMDHFVRSGNGVFPVEAVVTLHNLHGASNPLCCALSRDDTILATGGADSHLNLCQWGAALAPGPDAASKVVQSSIRIPFPAPVICTVFCQMDNFVAGGCMDGSFQVLSYTTGLNGLEIEPLQVSAKHAKYVKSMVWSPTEPTLATASADGTIILSKVQQDKMETITTLHFPGTVETVCFSEDGKSLFCYTRGTPYLSQFSLENDFEQIKINLNADVPGGGFEDHVSFAVMDIAVKGKYLALATDTSRNIILDCNGGGGNQVRNLYGHQNDGYSQPKLGFSNNGQYILGNTQEDSSICVWDIASTTIVKRLEGHEQPVRALYSSPHSDTLVTTSFDKTTKIWLHAA
jgi:WD40 repeat protein